MNNIYITDIYICFSENSGIMHPMHTEEIWKKVYSMIAEGKSLAHTDTYGIVSLSILPFDLDKVIPDNLHVIMAIECKLV